MLKIQEFCLKHPNDWEDRLSGDPYFLKIKKTEDLIQFNYDQINSPHNNDLCKEARGLILKNDFKIAAKAFNRFFNYGEGEASEIDWASALVEEKIDGTLSLVFSHKGNWVMRTRGGVDGENKYDDSDESFPSLFWRTYEKIYNNKPDGLYIYWTYVFELAAPENRLIQEYESPRIVLTGMFHNFNGSEFSSGFVDRVAADLKVERPKKYNLNNIEDVVAMAKSLKPSEEGYVVVDKFMNRLKVKNPAFFAMSTLRQSRNFYRLIATEAIDDYVALFPYDKEECEAVTKKYSDGLRTIETQYQEVLKHDDIASACKEASKYPLKWILIQLYKNSIKEKVQDYIYELVKSSRQPEKTIKQICEQKGD